VKSLHSTNLIALLGIDPFTFTGLVILLQRSKSGHATRLTAKTLRGHTLMTVDLSPSYKDVNLGAEVDTNAAIYFLHRDDRKPARPESIGWLAI
jgi:hypothetical protein